MIEVNKNLFVGAEQHCSFDSSDEWAIIHACKHPCHANAVGYKGKLSPTHPNYLIFESGKHLVLNLVDMEREFLPKFTNPIMETAMQFIDKYISNNKILVHCNQGQSRSPSLALLYLARQDVITNTSYSEATTEFIKIYPIYSPGTGIAAYLNRHWDYLLGM